MKTLKQVEKNSTKIYKEGEYEEVISLHEFLEDIEDGVYDENEGYVTKLLWNGKIIQEEGYTAENFLEYKDQLLALQQELGELEVVWCFDDYLWRIKLHINTESTEKLKDRYGKRYTLENFIKAYEDGDFMDEEGEVGEIIWNRNVIWKGMASAHKLVYSKEEFFALQEEIGEIKIVWYNK